MARSSNPVDAYAQAVASGKVPAGTYHRLACRRHVADRRREGAKVFPYRFDLARAERVFRFCAQLQHYKGAWAGQPFALEPWQQFIVGSIFGWVHVGTERRRFRTAYVEVPRKNGKSILSAAIAIYAVFFDGEAGAEGVCAATKRQQARIVFDIACELVKRNPRLQQRIGRRVGSLYQEATASKLEPLGADADSTDGLHLQFVSLDEFHAHKTGAMYDVLDTAMGARQQPLMLQITTAGDDPLGPCGKQHDYVCRILDGVDQNDRVFGFLAHADVRDDPFAETTWRKANPNYGISVEPGDLAALALQAKQNPSDLVKLRMKRLNVWVTSSTPWLNLDGWKRGQSTTPPDLAGRPCWAGLDLSSKTDLTALVLVFPPTEDDLRWHLRPYVFTPEDGVEEREKQARAPYRQWIADGYLLTTPGNRIDHGTILSTLFEAHGVTPVQAIGFDPWNIGNFATELQAHWSEQQIVEIPQTITQLSEPSKEFEALVASGSVDAGGHPVLTWMVSNAVAVRDGNDNIKPTKDPKKSRGRIDGVVAAIMGLKLARMIEGADAASKYFEQHGLLA